MLDRSRAFAILLATTLLPACDGGDSAAAEKKTDAAAQDAKADGAAEAKDAKDAAKGKKEDRGNAKVTIGGTEWTATRCKARARGDKLKLSCSTTSMNDGKVDRQALDINILGYKGVGSYKPTSASYTGVGFDGKKAAAEKDADQAAKNALADASKSATIHMLSDVTLEVTQADGTVVDGTFSAPANDLMKTPAFEDGTFHAILDEKKK